MKPFAAIIANPASGNASETKLEETRELLCSKGLEIDILRTRKHGEAELLAKKVSKKDPRFIMAAGGDGTVNEVINGIAGTDIPLSILPTGTTNILAREIGLSGNIAHSTEVALNGKIKNIRIGILKSEGRSRYFCLMAGIGYDASVVLNLSNREKIFMGRGAYVLSGLRTISTWNPEPVKVIVDGKSYVGFSLIVSNSRKYAGSFDLAPEADLSEPHFHIFIVHGKKRLDIIRLVFGILFQRQYRLKGVTCIKGKNIEIEGNAHVQLDGDYYDTTPAVISIAPFSLKLFVP